MTRESRPLVYIPDNAKINIKETKCMFRGDPYHEYIIDW
jgi:hypothetical protein